MRIYMDTCCLNRPFDDQSIDRNRLESEAVLVVVKRIESGAWVFISSDAILAELEGMRDRDRKSRVEKLLSLSNEHVAAGPAEQRRWSELASLGFGELDALHIACAEAARCDVLLTTDDPMIQKSKRFAERVKIRVANPLDWVQEQVIHED